MKRSFRLRALSVLAALIITATPMAAMSLSAYAATTSIPATSNLQAVTEKGNLVVTVPDNISDTLTVNAYEMLQLVIPKDSVWVAGTAMTNEANSKNIYVVTDPWADFFSAAKTSYNTSLTAKDNLFLTYNTTDNQLVLSDTQPTGTENVNFIKIDNAAYDTANNHIGRLDKTFFEADIISRIISSPNNNETAASAARLLSDWASRYVKAKGVASDASGTKTAAADPDPAKFTLSDLTYGYYVVITSDDAGTEADKTAINQSILNVPMATNVTLKATPITIDKNVTNLVDSNLRNNGETNKANSATARIDEDTANGTKYDKITANVGDILQYKVESHIPSLRSYDLTADAAKLLGIADTDALTEDNFTNKITGNFVYVLKDKMINQDFIIADTTVNTVSVTGLTMTVDTFTAVVKKIGDAYYLVDSAISNPTVNNAIARVWETEYTVASKSNFFAVNFDLAKLKTLELDGKDVVFTYNAELRGEAGNNDSTNTAQITYSNDPFDSSSNDTITDVDNVYTYDLKIDKKFSDGATTAQYANVKFKLYSDSAKSHVITFVDNAAANGGSYRRAESSNVTTTEELAVNTQDGTLQLHGLGEGTYYLVEQPNDNLNAAGYNVANTITVVITAKDGSDIIDTANIDLFNASAAAKSSATLDNVSLDISKLGSSEYGIEFDVLNQKGFRLPLTGEYGNYTLAIGGILLVAIGGTVIVLVNRKKKISLPA